MLLAPILVLLATAPKTVAVAYFDNNTDRRELDALGRGLADMLITDLGRLESLQIVEREKLNQVMAELKLSKSKFIDPKTAQKLGKGLAAQYLMSGGYVLAQQAMRIDARVLEVETGKVIASEQVEGKQDEFFALEKELVDILIRALSLKLGMSEKTKLRSNETESFEAFSRYSAGLVAKDAGDEDEARRQFQAALDADPGYRAAKTATERLAIVFERDADAKAKSYDDLRRTLDPKAKDFAQRIDAALIQLDSTDSAQLKKKLELLIWLAERDLAPSTPPMSRVALEALGVAYRHVDNPAQWDNLPKVCEYFIARYPREDYPKTYCKNAILNSLRFHLKSSDRKEKEKSWASEQAGYLKNLEPDDWRRALAENDAAMQRLLAIYAKKSAR